MQNTSSTRPNVRDSDWVGFPGGELEGKRPRTLCQACRRRLEERTSDRPLCFQCYRAKIDRDRALKAAGQLNTASAERFQTALPFEPVNRPRLEMLKVERTAARTATRHGAARFEDRRRQAQVAARHALQQIAAGLPGSDARPATPADRAHEIAYAIHAAELQLPESWIPFVVSR